MKIERETREVSIELPADPEELKEFLKSLDNKAARELALVLAAYAFNLTEEKLRELEKDTWPGTHPSEETITERKQLDESRLVELWRLWRNGLL